MRTLIYVPIIHTTADLGSLAIEVNKRGVGGLGREIWEKHKNTVEEFWNVVEDFFISLDASGMKIYQDGLVAEGEIAQKIVEAGLKSGSKNYEIISRLVGRGAILVRTEDFKLIKEEREYLLALTQAKSIIRKLIAFLLYKMNANRLLRKRDKFIARRINETLKDREKGVIFIGAYHYLIKRLPEDIQIIEIKDTEKVREYHKLLSRHTKKKERFEELAKYLISKIDDLFLEGGKQ